MCFFQLNKNYLGKIKRNKGFSLLELVLAIAIFSLSSFALGTILIDGNINVRQSSERLEALSYAKEGIEASIAVRNGNWADLVDGDHGLLDTDGVWSFSSTSEIIDNKYTRVVNISDTDPVATSTKKVSVNVSWYLTPVRLASTTLETILTDWRNQIYVDTCSGVCLSLQNGLIGHWKMDDTDGTTVVDSGPTPHNGISSNNISGMHVAGRIGSGALAFSYNNNDYISLGDTSLLFDNAHGSVAAWFQIAPTGLGSYPWVGGGLFPRNYLLVQPSGPNNVLSAGLSNYDQTNFQSTTNILPDTWYFGVLTWDQSSATGNLYVNGNLEQTVNYDGGNVNPTSYTIGGLNGGGSLNGIIDDFRIYNRVLTQEEITALASGLGN